MAKLLIATPAYDPMICAQTYTSALSMDKCGMDIEAYTPNGYTVAQARVKAAQRALDTHADWVMFFDSDMVLRNDTLKNLLSHDKDAVFGYCAKTNKDDDTTSLAKTGRNNYDLFWTKTELHELAEQGTNLIEIRGGGFGCVLVRTSVFERIAKPWFHYVYNQDGRKLSEDYYFCTQCREAGIKLYADTRTQLGHVRQIVV